MPIHNISIIYFNKSGREDINLIWRYFEVESGGCEYGPQMSILPEPWRYSLLATTSPLGGYQHFYKPGLFQLSDANIIPVINNSLM